MIKSAFTSFFMAAAILVGGQAASAQISEVDPNAALSASGYKAQAPTGQAEAPSDDAGYDVPAQTFDEPAAAPAQVESDAKLTPPINAVRQDIFTEAEKLFGKGSQGLAELLEKILQEQGEPVAYIAGQEAGGAFVLGLRYGSGTMRHRVEGDRPVYWTGPSLGFDFGADANKVFVLVYNLYDSQDLFRRYPAAEGHAYAVGGFTASYLRRGDVVLIPVRLGVGLRLGVNAGYMHFTEKQRWLPL